MVKLIILEILAGHVVGW